MHTVFSKLVWYSAYTLIGLLTLRCGTPSRNDILTKEEMAQVLRSAYLSEAQGQQQVDSVVALRKYAERLATQKLGRNDATLDKSISYYFSQPDELEEVIDIVIDSLTVQQEKLSARQSNSPTANR